MRYLTGELKRKPKDENLLRHIGYQYLVSGKPDSAEQLYRRALAVNPKCSRCLLNIGRSYAVRGDYAKALEQTSKAIAINPKEAPAYAFRAQIKEQLGDAIDALFDYDKAVSLDTTDAGVYLDRAAYNLRARYFSLALADIEKARALAPQSGVPLLRRAEIFYEQRKLPEALAALSDAIRIDSTAAESYTGRAAVWLALDSPAQALQDYNAAIRRSPADYSLYLFRSDAQHRVEDMDGFCADLSSALALMPQGAAGDSMRGVVQARASVYCDASKPSYYYQRGVALYNLGRMDSAVAMYTAGLQKFPTNAMLLSFRGNAHFAKERWDAALADYTASIVHRENLRAEFALNQPQTGAPQTATRAADMMVADVQRGTAKALLALGRYPEALTAIENAITTAGRWEAPLKEEEFVHLRGTIHLAAGKPEAALQDFERCIRIAPRYAPVYASRAMVRAGQALDAKPTVAAVTAGINGQSFGTVWNLPVRSGARKSAAVLQSALADCNRAIELDARLGMAWYMRGCLKLALEQPDYCLDILKALSLGYAGAPEIMRLCKP